MEKLINNKGERKRTDGTPRRITSSRILIQWNDSPREETSFHDMPEELRESFDRWLTLIEDQENAKSGL